MPTSVFFMPKHDNAFTVSSHRLSCFFGSDVVNFSEPLHVCAARTGESDPAASDHDQRRDTGRGPNNVKRRAQEAHQPS